MTVSHRSNIKPTVGCGVIEGVGVKVGVRVAVGVLVTVGVAVGVSVGGGSVGVLLGAGVALGVDVGASNPAQAALNTIIRSKIGRTTIIASKDVHCFTKAQ